MLFPLHFFVAFGVLLFFCFWKRGAYFCVVIPLFSRWSFSILSSSLLYFPSFLLVVSFFSFMIFFLVFFSQKSWVFLGCPPPFFRLDIPSSTLPLPRFFPFNDTFPSKNFGLCESVPSGCVFHPFLFCSSLFSVVCAFTVYIFPMNSLPWRVVFLSLSPSTSALFSFLWLCSAVFIVPFESGINPLAPLLWVCQFEFVFLWIFWKILLSLSTFLGCFFSFPSLSRFLHLPQFFCVFSLPY